MSFTFLKRLVSSIPTPAAGKVTVFIDSATGLPRYKDETGVDFSLGTAFTGGNLSTAVNWKQFAAIASGATTDIGGAAGNFGHITGSATINSLGTAPQGGALRVVVFDGACTLTHDATSLILPTGANITTAAGDVAEFVSDGSGANWRCTGYRRANGQALASTSPPSDIIVALGDETTAITTGTAKVTIRAPRAMTLTKVKVSLTTASSSGLPQFDVKKNGTSIFSTKPTIDATEKTTETAATPAVFTGGSTIAIAADDELTFDIVAAGTGAAGAKVTLVATSP
jgi:hypothetical protein